MDGMGEEYWKEFFSNLVELCSKIDPFFKAGTRANEEKAFVWRDFEKDDLELTFKEGPVRQRDLVGKDLNKRNAIFLKGFSVFFLFFFFVE